MLLTRWNPWGQSMWGDLNRLQSEVNRIFERYEGGRQEPGVFPAMNLWEDENGYRLEAELPGIELADLEIAVTGPNQLTLKGERKTATIKDRTPHRQERVFGAFVRTVTLPSAIDAEKVDATLEDGVLKLKLPKHESAKPRRIVIKS